MSDTGAIKHDDDKLPVHLLPAQSLEEVARVLQFGAKKYAPRNWERGFDHSRLYGATMRHLLAYWRGEDNDKESGLPHLAHAACCALMLLQTMLTHPDLDDRPGAIVKEDD